jgi:hypothetical protein
MATEAPGSATGGDYVKAPESVQVRAELILRFVFLVFSVFFGFCYV